MGGADKPVVWLAGEIRTPPFSKKARVEAGFLLRRLQRGETLGMPHVRPMPQLGRRVYELRVPDVEQSWRVMVRLDTDAVVIADVFSKRTRTTPSKVIEACRERLRRYDQAARG
jgi:phage-related protein